MSNDNGNQGDNSHPQVNFCSTVPYINNDAGLWLAQLEAVFPHFYNSAQKCKVVISQLPPDALRSVRDVLSTVNDATDPYGAIKQELLQRLATPHAENIAQLLRGEQLGDRTPRQLLSRMLGLAGSPVNGQEVFLREIFLQKLLFKCRKWLQPAHLLYQCKTLQRSQKGSYGILRILPQVLLLFIRPYLRQIPLDS
ncbi:UNVERIFIED_CONTAM: hypothetical protein RMT77_008383 [Armadillidium vulgare]